MSAINLPQHMQVGFGLSLFMFVLTLHGHPLRAEQLQRGSPFSNVKFVMAGDRTEPMIGSAPTKSFTAVVANRDAVLDHCIGRYFHGLFPVVHSTDIGFGSKFKSPKRFFGPTP